MAFLLMIDIMMILTVASLAVAAASPVSDDWLVRDLADRRAANEQTVPLVEKAMASWQGCLKAAAIRMARSRETADLVTTAAMAKCAEWEQPLRIGFPTYIAAKMTNMPFADALRIARSQREENLDQLKLKQREQVLAIVVEARSGPTRRRR